MDLMHLFQNCELCPRACGIDRFSGKQKGFCREEGQLKVAYIGPHFGEEPPITGTRGSGTVFFTGCSLKCTFCQNYQISRDGLGEIIDMDTLFERVEKMVQFHTVHNINLVTPDHFFPYAFILAGRLRKKGYCLPLIYNLSGYQSKQMLRLADEYADIYLPDFKYSDKHLAKRLSGCEEYPDAALAAISEMIRQKGFLDSFTNGSALATQGVLVRHLVLPGYAENSINALTTLFLEFGSRLPLSLMSQYAPVLFHNDIHLRRQLTRDEFDRVYTHTRTLGFEHLFVQFPGKGSDPVRNKVSFIPDFRSEHPFSE